jgi:DNA invertase Pin-like site-specific DNA recombinase
MGRLFITLISAIAELEADLIRERVRAGIRRRKLEGLPIGRQPLNVDRDAIVSDRLRGMSLTDVARRYSVSRASVVRWVREARQTNPDLSAGHQSIHQIEQEVAA